MISRRAWSAIGLLAVILVVLRLPVLSTGLHMDDMAQRAMVAGHYPVPRAAWDLYTFSTGEPSEVQALLRAGALPWWSDPQLRLSALRPLSSLLVWVDIAALDARGAHVHSLLWWFAMLAALGWALHPILGVRWALAAVALYAFDDAHAFPLAWLANRAAIVSGAFGWLALGAYVRRRPGWLVALMSTLSMAGGEYGLCALAYVVAHAGFLDDRPWRTRARALLPAVVPVLIYLGLHRVGGFGAQHSGIYVDPAAEPAAFVAALVERAPRLLLDMATGSPLVVFEGWSAAVVWGVAAVAVGASFAAISWLRTEGRSVARWAVVGALMAVVPVCASFLSERLTVLASVGVHVLSAGVLVTAVEGALARRWSAQTLVALAASVPIALGHVWVASHAFASKVDTVRAFNDAGRRLAEAMPVHDETAPQERWVLLAAGDPMMLIYPPHLRALGGHPRPGALSVLCLSPGPLTMRRVTPRALEITAANGWLQSPLERFFRRADRPLPDSVGFDGLQVDVVERDGSVPKTVRFTFDRRLEASGLRVMSVGLRGVFRYPVAAVGSTMPLAPGPDAVSAAAGLR
ncbi:MAG: hypothetical protein ACE37F_07430 [Nannocystaceae bacterium]|nr:hypothetical protein [bacterium]